MGSHPGHAWDGRRGRSGWLCWVACGLTLGVGFARDAAGRATLPEHAPAGDPIRMQDFLRNGPLAFEANQGQTDSRVGFLHRGSRFHLFLTPTEAVLALRPGRGKPSVGSRQVEAGPQGSKRSYGPVLRMQLLGGTARPQVVGLDRLPGKANYLLGNDPARWRTDVPTYAKVEYRKVYPGVDLVFYGRDGAVEFDFVVAPGADSRRIRLAFRGVERLEPMVGGDLLLHAAGGSVRLRQPHVYQEIGAARKPIEARYVLTGRRSVGIRVARYDVARPLVIDPVLVFSTYLGGTGDDNALGVAVDGTGSVYVAGRTFSADFPTLNPAQSSIPDRSVPENVFVTKLTPAGSLVYSTYIGGTGRDGGHAIAVDSAGNAYLTGATNSFDFPTTPGAFQRTLGGSSDGFVLKLGSNGNALVYSTYLGGSGLEKGFGIAVDSAGSAYVMGYTNSADFPATPGALQTALAGGFDAFVTKVNPAGTALVFSTFLGGSGDEGGLDFTLGTTPGQPVPADIGPIATSHLAVDAAGNVYLTGRTTSTNFPTRNPIQAMNGGGFDAFVAKLNPAGSALIYSTYLGGSGDDFGTSLAVDAAGNAYVTGQTGSTNFPTTAGAVQRTLSGASDAFVTKVNPAGSALVYSTHLGGVGPDNGQAIAVDAAGNAYVTGRATAFFPTVNPIQAALGGFGAPDAFVT